MKKMITLCITANLILTLAACADNTGQSHNDPITPISLQDYSVDEPNYPVSVQDYSVGKPKIEECYDDPNNPVAKQDYSVGEPNNE